MKRFISTWNRTSLIKRIAIGVVVGAVLGLLVPKFTVIGLLGDMFVGWLEGNCPTFGLCLGCQCPFPNARRSTKQHEDSYCSLSLWDLCGSFDGCYLSLYFPISLKLGAAAATKATAPQGVGEVFKDLFA